MQEFEPVTIYTRDYDMLNEDIGHVLREKIYRLEEIPGKIGAIDLITMRDYFCHLKMHIDVSSS